MLTAVHQPARPHGGQEQKYAVRPFIIPLGSGVSVETGKPS